MIRVLVIRCSIKSSKGCNNKKKYKIFKYGIFLIFVHLLFWCCLNLWGRLHSIFPLLKSSIFVIQKQDRILPETNWCHPIKSSCIVRQDRRIHRNIHVDYDFMTTAVLLAAMVKNYQISKDDRDTKFIHRINLCTWNTEARIDKFVP